jgi:alpha-tubulin suppressor-like RCC1 family protein
MKKIITLLSFIILISQTVFAQQISTGNNYTLMIKTDGSLLAWGDNSSGQLGDGTTINKYVPTQIGTGWKSISAYGTKSMAVKKDGTLWEWGSGAGNSPVQLGIDADWNIIATGSLHNLALKNDGSLWAWGNNLYGQLGIGNRVNQSQPSRVGDQNDWASISLGLYHSLAIKTDGRMYSWGSASDGQLGNGMETNSNYFTGPSLIVNSNGWKVISAVGNTSYAIKTDGTLWACGFRMTSNDPIRNSTFVKISLDTDWTTISAGPNHIIGLKTNRSLWAWGNNSSGQLGDGTTINKYSPARIGGDNGWDAVATGSQFSVALNNCSLFTWGINGGNGNLGNNILSSGTNVLTPTRIEFNVSPKATITASGPTTLFYDTDNVTLTANDGASYSWGRNEGNYSANTQSITVNTAGNYILTVTDINGCSDISSIPITAIYAPAGNTTQTFCSGATVVSLNATGTAIKWYAARTGGTALVSSTVLNNGATYYASQTVNGAESADRLSVTVSIPKISTIASLANVALGSNASFTGSISGSSTFQWQSNINDIGWINLPNNFTYTGSNTNKLTINNIKVSNHLQEFRLIATAGTCRDTSNVATTSVIYTLPVELSSFNATLKQNQVNLNWETSSELNNNYFTIAKSNDGKSFSQLTNVPSKGDGGMYLAADQNPFSGTTYYKLSQTDKDGKTKELGIKAIKISLSNAQKVMIYPNPTQNEVKVSFEKDFYTTAKLIDLQGKTIQRKSISINDNELTFDLKSLDAGSYLIQLEGKGTDVQKLIKE